MRLTLLLLLCWAGLLSAQTIEKRVALVIGNTRYANAPLANPANDAREIAAILRRAGFTVTEMYDQNFSGFNNAVTDFTRKFTDPNTVALFYYAGHGIQENGENYLVPIDADSLAEDEISYRCVPLERITTKMKAANNYMNIVILDACRRYPVHGKERALERGLAQFDEELSESLVAYATAPGRTALDQSDRPNGLFTESLLKHMVTPGLEISELFFEVRREVKERSNDQQIPSLTNNLTHKFYFFIPPAASPSQPQPGDADHDGVPDAADRCPYDAGPEHLQGCPDSDNDGVIDLLDKCPQLAGTIAAQGCPETQREASSPWRHCFGVSYSRFGSNSGSTYEKVHYNAYQAYYAVINKIGAFISLGGYSGSFDLSSSSGISIPSSFIGSIGPGVRFLKTPSDLRACVFAGPVLFNVIKDNEIFGHTVEDNLGFQVLLACNIGDIGFMGGYLNGFENLSGLTVGLHYNF